MNMPDMTQLFVFAHSFLSFASRMLILVLYAISFENTNSILDFLFINVINVFSCRNNSRCVRVYGKLFNSV